MPDISLHYLFRLGLAIALTIMVFGPMCASMFRHQPRSSEDAVD